MLQTNSLEKPTYLTWRVVFATLTACLGSISFGYVLGYPSPVQDHLMDQMNWSDEQMTWFSSIASLGAMFGAIVGLYTIERFGRKLTIMLCSLPFVGGWLLIAGAKLTSLLYIGRFLTGAGMGVVSFTVPLYIVEISPAKYRGTLASANQLGVTIGILFSYCFGAVLNWRWLAITGAIPGAAMAILITSFPETPRWLIKNDKISEACHVLVYLRGTSYEECELESKEIQSTLETGEPVSLKEFLKPMIYRPFIIGLMLMMFQQFSGINAVTSYASQILDDAGMSNANVEEIAITVVQTIGTAVSCLIIDQLGRRLLLIFPGALMGVSMIVLGASRYFDGFPSYITLISLCVYIIGFSMGLGPIPWVVTAEILPTKVRGFASSFATQVNWLSAFIVIKTYVNMVDALHSYGCYWVYAAVCLISVVYVFLFLPETKGKTLEEVEKLFIDKERLLNGETGKKYGAIHA